ncbi:glycoside hydrolase family 3 protein [Deferribacterales bacterium RsTz2092]|nr:glycosyl hydrolase [Deferribacterales bacterium]
MKRLVVLIYTIFALSAEIVIGASAPNAGAYSYEEKLGQMFMFGFRGGGATTAKYAADYRQFLKFVQTGGLGGVVLFNKDVTDNSSVRNIYNAVQLDKLTRTLQNASPLPLLVAIDQEGGGVNRLKKERGFFELPSPAQLGELKTDDVYQMSFIQGKSLSKLGINVNFAPSLDVNINKNNPIIGALGRSFSADYNVVITQAGAFARGMLAAGVVPCFKHFPGHGSSQGDSHKGLTDITATWTDVELEPYRALLKDINPALVMTSHLFNEKLDSKYPASLSNAIVTKLLREKLGFNGVIISDDLQMGAITDNYSLEETLLLAINAGNDMLLFGNNLSYDRDLYGKVWQAALKLYHDGKITEQRIDESFVRIINLKQSIDYAH